MFGNFETLGYMTLCIVAFLGGALAVQQTTYKMRISQQISLFKWSAYYLAALPFLIISILGSIVSIRVYLAVLPLDQILVALTGHGSLLYATAGLKSDISGSGISWVAAVTTASCSWSLWLWLQRSGNRARRLVLGLMLSGAILSQFFASLLTLTRTPILILLMSLGVVWLLDLSYRGKLNVRRSTFIVIVGLLAGLLLFGGVEQGRSTPTGNKGNFIVSLVGYFPGAYNRLAAILDHKLLLDNAGSSYYILNGIWLFPGASAFNLIETGKSWGLNLPSDSYSNWIKSFQTTRNAGLNGGLTWTTAYGAVAAETGWWGIVFFALYGAVSQLIWRMFLQGHQFGVIIYPIFAVAQLQWHATLFVMRRETFIGLMVLGGLVVAQSFWLNYGRSFSRTVRHNN